LDCKSTGATNVARFLTGATTSSEVAQFGRSDQAVNLSIDYDGAGAMGIGTTTAHPFLLKTGATEKARLDTSGRLLVGTSSSRSNWFNTTGVDPLLQVESASNARIAITRNDNTDNGPDLLLGKSRSTSYAVVSNGDSLGRISFQGADGSEMVAGAYIQGFVDGTPGANDLPSRLVFSTCSDGSASPTERLRIAQNGAWGLAGANYGSSGQVLTSNGSGSAPTWGSGSSAVKAWVNFNGTGTVAIRASDNVSSITDNGVDDYTVNFSNALVDANYATAISVNQEDSNTYSQHFGVVTVSNASYSLKSASQVRMRGRNTISSNYDPFDVSVAIFR
jgi:hypothetical protein